MNTSTIYLDLSDNNQYVFNNENFLFSSELQKVRKLVDVQISKNNNYDLCQYNTIFINGSRGAGKTSFIQTLLYNFNMDNNLKKEIEFLDYLDPTMLEPKTHIFLTIISLIKNKVQNKINNISNENIRFEQYKIWEKHLEKLAAGLPLIGYEDEFTKPDFWDDATHIMYKGLDDVNSAFNLRKNFNEFLIYSLNILEKKYFLLTIDDVDTDPKKAWPLLETIRKYLCTDKFILILTGDIRLYEEIVSRKQKEKISSEFYSELMDQYLRKILPLRNRISLKTINEILRENSNIQIKNLNILFKNYLENIFSIFGIQSSYIRQGYINYITKQPLRTQIDFYRVFTDKHNIDIKDVYEIFANELEKWKINISALLENSGLFTSSILNLLINKEILNDCYQLQPINSDNGINACLFISSLLLSQRIKNNPQLIFDFFIRIAYIKNISLLSNSSRRTISRQSINFSELIKYTGLTNDIDLRQISCYLVAYLRSFFNENSSYNGIVTLRGFAKKAGASSEENKGTFDYELKNAHISNSLKLIACLPLSVSIFSNKKSSVNEYSFFTLIASLYDLICEIESGNQLSAVLPKMAQVKNYPVPNDSSGYYESEAFELDDFLNDENSDWIEFEKLFSEWIEFCKINKFCIPPYIIGKVCTRIFYSFQNITDYCKKQNSLGELMHLFVCELFHAVIIEECLEYSSLFKTKFFINNNNITKSDYIFFKNLNLITKENVINNLPLTKILLTCPILLPFISFNKDNMECFDNFYKKIDFINHSEFLSNFVESNLFEVLNRIELKEKEIINKPSFSLSPDNIHITIDTIKKHFSKEDFLNKDNNKLIMQYFSETEARKFGFAMSKLRKKIEENPDLW